MVGDHRVAEPGGGREKFETFFRREFPKVVGLLIKAGIPREDAMDAAEDAMSVAFVKWEQIDTPARYVRTVALRRAFGTAGRQREEIRRAVRGDWVPRPRDDSERTAAVDDRMRLLPLLAGLPRQQRIVIALHLDHLDTDEIAELMGIEPVSVRSHLRHARKALRRTLEASGFLDGQVER